MIYLDNAATSFPKPASVPRRVDEILRRIGGNPGRGSHRMALEASRVIFAAREMVAAVIGAPDASRIAFTKNATEAVNIALKGLLKPGDHAVTTTFEHNSVAKTFKWLSDRGVIVTKVAPGGDGRVEPSDIRRAMRPATRIVCVTHASNVFGTLQPVSDIGEVCRASGVIFMTDGAQTVGALPVDVASMNLDVLVATGHKALFGPQGTGFLYAREGVEIEPLVSGGTGELEAALEMPERLEAGTMNMPGIGGLSSGVEFVMAEGVGKIRAHEVALVGELIAGLRGIKGVRIIGALDAAQRASLVSFTIDGVSVAEAGMRLDNDFSIMARSGAHCAPEAHREAGTHPEGAVRISPGYFSTPDEIKECLRAVKAIAGS